ncbi:MAG TPA: DNA polymerase III subunit gamma/tau [Candidatus Paceibacterota bacterium]|nr:DNA polymerase III subunit gamma/tau [Candidatus Paceibacterota bacterium]HRZ34393.1 DNA polymerase III subunit gamma/tau [Candidatus Paceibacterota bacterium]
MVGKIENTFQALYTKYRPQKFSEVIGQDHVVDVLKAALKQGKVAHAYLFSGSRGTGKTSVARILASEIGTTSKDLYEIDAASNNGVEEIRLLNEAVLTLPFDSKYKVYILDEVHMLSKPAFNALLKTLEEPPKHIVFILATTEPQKLPETVISRCEHYEFKSPNRAVLKKMVMATAKNEGYELEPEAAELIAILGDGSFRDALTSLQKLIRSSDDKKLSLAEAEKVLGAPQISMINSVVEAILVGDKEKGLSALATAAEKNIDAKVFVKLLLEKIRAALLIKIAPTKKDLFEGVVGEDDLAFLSGLVTKSVGRVDSKVLSRLLSVYEETLSSPLPYLPLELAIIDFAQEKG